MITISIHDKKFHLSYRTALKVFTNLQQDLSQFLSTCCVECEKTLTQDDEPVPYAAIIPNQQGYLCKHCAQNLVITEFTVENYD